MNKFTMRASFRLTVLTVFAALSLGFGQADAAQAVGVVTSGIGPGGTALPVALGIAQGGQFFYSYDSVSCASLAAPAVTTTAAPVGGALTTSSATEVVPAGSPCAGSTMAGKTVTYTPTAGVPDAGPLLVAGGNYWQCTNGIAADPNDCARRQVPLICTPPTGNAGYEDCTLSPCNTGSYVTCLISWRYYYNISGNGYNAGGTVYAPTPRTNLPVSCGSDFAASDSAAGCVDPAPLALPANLNPVLQDPYTVKATSPDGTASVTSSMTPTPAGKNLGECNCSAGDPVSIGSGNMHDRVVDYATAGQNPLTYTRFYNSQALGASFATTLGTGWRSTYDRYIHTISASSVAVERPDGKILQFILVGGAWVPDSDTDMQLKQSGTTWVLTDHDGTVETYSMAIAHGTGSGSTGIALLSITQRNGYTQTMGYNAAYQLATVKDSYGRTLTLTYSGNYLHSVATPDSTTITFGYTGALLTSAGYSTTPATSITYGYTNALLTSVKDQLGNLYASWTYDSYGRALSSWNGTGSANLTKFAYNADGSRTVTSPLGLVETYKFNNFLGGLKLTEVDRAASATTAASTRTMTYDQNGYLLTSTDWLGHITYYSNDVHGNQTQITDPLGRVTTITYNATFPNLPASIAAPGITTALTYDALGEVLTKSQTDTTGNASNNQVRTWTYTWANALLASVQTPRTDLTVKTAYGYDATGALTSTTDPLLHKTTITSHSGGGRPLTVTDPNGVVTTLAYDGRQRLISSSVATSAGARLTGWTYDAAGDLTKLTLPDSSYTAWGYDTAHRVTSMSDLAGDKTTYTLDNAGNATATSVANAGGTVTASSAATFDAIGRKLSETPAGSGKPTSWTYDVEGNLLTMSDGLARVTSYTTYDAANRLTQWTAPDTGVFSYNYDVQDHTTQYMTNQGFTTQYQYDAWGDVLHRYSQANNNNSYTYDGDGNLTYYIDGDNAVTDWTWDAGDRPLTKTFPNDTAENVAYTYDQTGTGFSFGIGRLTTMTDQVGTLTRMYDERGNLLKDTRATSTGGTAHSFITTRTYDAAGRVATLAYPSGLALTYTRNTMGQVTGVNAGATSLVSAANYLPFGPLSGLSFGNAVTETWTHDASYRATGITDTGAGAVGKISSLGYTLDAADNVTAIVDNVTAANNQAFTYNTRDRLLTANGAYGAYTWTYYDYIGDRLSEQLGTATATTYGYYADLVTSVGSTKISYIGGGVVSAVTPASGAASTFTYNQANRLASATTGLGVEHYLYDGAGALFARGTIVAPVSVSQFQYDLDGRLLEEDSNNAAQADYIYLDNRPVAVYDPTHGIFSYLHDDRLGTPVKATSSAAATVWSAAYNPFGLIYAQSGSIVQDLRLPGQFADPVTGRYHNGWRDYNPAIGRYEEVDPLNRLAGWNVFGYADQNPLKYVDPSGLFGLGLDGGGSAEFGLYAGAGGTVSFGGGFFFNGLNPFSHPSLGGFSSRGGFAGAPGWNVSSPDCPNDNNWAAGAYAGGGLGAFLTNADNVSDLSGPFKTFSFNVGWEVENLNLQFSWGRNDQGQLIWFANYGGPVGLITGGGFGGSISQYNTNTKTTNDGAAK